MAPRSSKPKQAAKAGKNAVQAQPETVFRVFEVVRAVCTVHDEPHIEAEVLNTKIQGDRIMCGVISMNGWLRLVGERGWVLWKMFGAAEGLADVVQLADASDADNRAVLDYQPQGMCCLEVTGLDAVEAHSQPDASSEVTLRCSTGEHIFCDYQSFDGWLHLFGDLGWVQVPIGGKSQLKAKDPAAVDDMDLWALADFWRAARNARGGKLDKQTTEDLKKFEQLIAGMVKHRFTELCMTGNSQQLLNDGLIVDRMELEQPSAWLKQRLYVRLLEKMVTQVEKWRSLAPNLQLSTRLPPLPAPDDDEDGSMGFWSAACLPFEYNDTTYMMAPNGVLIEPNTRELVGMWDSASRDFVPLVMIQIEDIPYVMAPSGLLIDPSTQDPVGFFNADTKGIDPLDSRGMDEDVLNVEGSRQEINLTSVVDAEAGVLEMAQKHLERAQQCVERKCWHTAAAAYSKALEACQQSRAIDVEVECEMLRGRAHCWENLEDYEKLAGDAQMLLSLEASAPDAKEWLRLASQGRPLSLQGRLQPPKGASEAAAQSLKNPPKAAAPREDAAGLDEASQAPEVNVTELD